MMTWGERVAHCRFRLLPLWRVPAQDVVAQRLVGLYPLLPLMQPQGRAEPAAVLAQCQELILEQVPPGEARADAYVALGVFGGLVWPVDLVMQILRRRALMMESAVYRHILDEGREVGRQQGLQEGLQQGQVERLHKDLLQVLEVRFGVVPADLAERVQEFRDLEELEGLLKRALLVASVEAFAQGLEGPARDAG